MIDGFLPSVLTAQNAFLQSSRENQVFPDLALEGKIGHIVKSHHLGEGAPPTFRHLSRQGRGRVGRGLGHANDGAFGTAFDVGAIDAAGNAYIALFHGSNALVGQRGFFEITKEFSTFRGNGCNRQ